MKEIEPEMTQNTDSLPKRRRPPRDLSRKRKLAYLLSQEVRRIVDDLDWRKWLLMEVWARMRTRAPLISVLRSRFEHISAKDLLMMPVDCLELLGAFYQTLDAFRFYLETTEDMPTALETSYERYRLRLVKISKPLVEALDRTHAYKNAFPLILPQGGEILEDS